MLIYILAPVEYAQQTNEVPNLKYENFKINHVVSIEINCQKGDTSAYFQNMRITKTIYYQK